MAGTGEGLVNRRCEKRGMDIILEIKSYEMLNKKNNSVYIKSPLNYVGGKYKILNQLLPYFPKNINTFVDLFCGWCNVGINVKAKKIVFNDNLKYLIEMLRVFQDKDYQEVTSYINDRINKFHLSQNNEKGYKRLRDNYNKNKKPLDLFVLLAYAFNHQIRFNSKHYFNNTFGRSRSSYNKSMEQNLKQFMKKLKTLDAVFKTSSFEDFNFWKLGRTDFVYCDPPYLITTGSYNDWKRGFKGWTEKEERKLLSLLDKLDKKGIKFGLSNVLKHKWKTNTILEEWLSKRPKYKINYLDFHYANSSYQTINRDKKASIEVIITNYKTSVKI